MNEVQTPKPTFGPRLMESRGVSLPDPFAQWPVSRAELVHDLQGGEVPPEKTVAEVRAFDAAVAAYKKIETDQRADRKNQKLHVGVALVTTDGHVFAGHNNIDEHGEEGVLRKLYAEFEKTHADKPLPRIAALALVGVHASAKLHEGDDDILPKQLHSHALPKGLPTPCYKCLYKIDRAVKAIAESRMDAFGVVPHLNFPILVTSTNGTHILRTDYATIGSLPFAGSKDAKRGAATL